MANRIHSKGEARHEEHVAANGLIFPGMLLQLNSSGQVLPHATEGGRHEKLFAEEDALQGNTVATVYTTATIVSCLLPVLGSVVNALIEDEQDISIGDELISAGNGCLKAATSIESGETLSQVVAVAEEARDLTGSNTSNTISAVRIVAG